MAIEAWFMEENDQDKRLPHHCNPQEYVSPDHLADIGVLYWHLNPKVFENDVELQKIRQDRGYNYMDILDLCPEKVENYEQKLRNFYTEHIHADEEIRYCLEGNGYFDVRDKDDRWIRIWIKPGDLIILPAGIYHRFTLDTTNYIKDGREEVLQAWYMDDSDEDQRLPHHRNPKEFVSLEKLSGKVQKVEVYNKAGYAAICW